MMLAGKLHYFSQARLSNVLDLFFRKPWLSIGASLNWFDRDLGRPATTRRQDLGVV